MTYEDFLKHFKVKKCYQDRAQCICPSHGDTHASLTITRGQRGILIKCHAGCSTEDILRAVGLKKSDLFYEERFFKGNWVKYVECRERRKMEDIYNYVYFNGNYAYTKIRLQDKKILYGILENDRFTYGLRGKSRKNAMYGDVKSLNKAISEGRTIFIPEGEKDVNTLKRKGYTALTYGAVNDWQQTMAQFFKDANVVILADNDSPGISAANNIECDLRGVAKNVKVIIPTPNIPKGDVSDYFVNHTKEEFEGVINGSNMEKAVTKKISTNTGKKQGYSLEKVLSDLHAERYETSDKGFGRLFADVFKGEHRYNPSRKDFMRYDGKRWTDDVEGLGARASAKSLSDALVRYAINVDTEGKYLKAVTPLCNIRNRNNMLQDSRDVYFFSNEELDTNDYFLNLQNGTLDLSEDNPKFMGHTPDMLLSKICNVEYNPAADCEEWKKFLMEIMQDDKEKVKYLQKIAGLSLTGNTEQETCFILYGSTTRNGKSTFCETLIYLLGDYALTMKPESLAVKQNLDSRQASGDIARLAGCRFCNASEPPKKMLFDTALLKSLLGRDSITARHLHQREFSFIPKFKLVINTNFLPLVADDTVFSSGRINVITFDRHFSPSEQDKRLKDKLRDKKELSGILNWCIEGLSLYRLEGLEPPQAVKTATNAYRKDSDKVGNFIEECLSKTGRNSKAKDVYELYAKWCDENGFGTENKQNFFSELKVKGIFSTSGTVCGKTVKNIVKGYEPDNDFVEYDGKEPLPFS